MMDEQGKYPIIMINFKGIRPHTAADGRKLIHDLIRAQSIALSLHNCRQRMSTIFAACWMIGVREDDSLSLQHVMRYLYHYDQAQDIVLIDEHDAPFYHLKFSTATLSEHKRLVDFMRSWMEVSLKDNPQPKKMMMTGVLLTSLVDLASGLNNMSIRVLKACWIITIALGGGAV